MARPGVFCALRCSICDDYTYMVVAMSRRSVRSIILDVVLLIADLELYACFYTFHYVMSVFTHYPFFVRFCPFLYIFASQFSIKKYALFRPHFCMSKSALTTLQPRTKQQFFKKSFVKGYSSN